MKKFLLTLVCAMGAMITLAQTTYIGSLVVTINGASNTTENAQVLYQDNGDGTCNFSLKNFILADETTNIPVGNIAIERMALTEGEDFNTFTYEDKIFFEDGDLEGVDLWYGKILFGEGLFIKVNGKVNDEKANVSIYIDITKEMGQIVEVEFNGTNPDYEANIQQLDVNTTPNTVVDMAGRRTSIGNRGLYIINGKKVIL